MAKQVILFVDDEKIVLESLKTQVRDHFGSRYKYETADNAADAAEVIDELMEDESDVLMIVSDWLMPGIRGDEFLIDLHKKYPNIVKVMLTGQADEAAVNRAKEQAGLHRCIYKPWSEEELIDTIRSGLEEL